METNLIGGHRASFFMFHEAVSPSQDPVISIGYGGPICQDSQSASFKVGYVSLLSFVLMGRL